MKLSAWFLTICCVTTVFTACKKEDNSSDTQAQKTLKAGKWQTIASTATLNYNGTDTTIDLFVDKDECEKDNTIVFVDNGKLKEDENENKCAGQDQVSTCEWGLLNNDTRIYIIDDNPDTLDIMELTSSQMKLKITKNNSSGTPVTFVETLKNIN